MLELWIIRRMEDSHSIYLDDSKDAVKITIRIEKLHQKFVRDFIITSLLGLEAKQLKLIKLKKLRNQNAWGY